MLKKKVNNKTNKSVICNNCVGAMVLHDYGLKFNSPFVNLFIPAPDYIKLLSNITYYLNSESILENITYDSSYPIGLLNKNIHIHFLHYKTFEEAKDKWFKRVKRIDFENLYVILVQQKSCSISELAAFDKLNFAHQIALVNNTNLTGHNSHYVIKGWEKEETLGHITDYSGLFGKRYYDQFDWGKFLNL